jgi:predicted RNA-binding protein (virulence factor B family)
MLEYIIGLRYNKTLDLTIRTVKKEKKNGEKKHITELMKCSHTCVTGCYMDLTRTSQYSGSK